MHHSWQGANVEKILFFCLAFVKSIGPTLFCLFSWTVLKSAYSPIGRLCKDCRAGPQPCLRAVLKLCWEDQGANQNGQVPWSCCHPTSLFHPFFKKNENSIYAIRSLFLIRWSVKICFCLCLSWQGVLWPLTSMRLSTKWCCVTFCPLHYSRAQGQYPVKTLFLICVVRLFSIDSELEYQGKIIEITLSF